jgi:ATP-dependent Clp protease adaptor protein ClpS
MSSQTYLDSDVLDKHQEKEATKPKRPPKVKVVLINDDFTPFDFVIRVIQDVFGKTEEEASFLAVMIDQQGRGVCGSYVKDIAEVKQMKVQKMAQEEGHPLMCTLEPEEPAPGPSGPRF